MSDKPTTGVACVDALASEDYSTKSGREKANVAAGACGADVACAAYGVPPGICGPIGGAIAGQVGKIWNSIFGNDDAEAARKRRAVRLAAWIASERAHGVRWIEENAVQNTVAALIQSWDEVIPEERGRLGGGAKETRVRTFGGKGEHAGVELEPETVTIYATETPARRLLAEMGAGLVPVVMPGQPGYLGVPYWGADETETPAQSQVIIDAHPAFMAALEVAAQKSMNQIIIKAADYRAKAARKRKPSGGAAVVVATVGIGALLLTVLRKVVFKV